MWLVQAQRSIDPIVEMMESFRADSRTDKINVGIGVYQDERGETPVFSAVKRAEAIQLYQENSKSYLSVAGNKAFLEDVAVQLFGPNKPLYASVQSVGGSGALRIIGDFCAKVAPESTLWLPNPTWANHLALFSGAKLNCKSFAYDYVARMQLLNGMQQGLSDANKGDFVVIHACCHNPTGIDLGAEDEIAFAQFIKEKGLVPIIDVAYLGLRDTVSADMAAVSKLIGAFDLAFVAYSASKTFGLYRDRVGAAFIVGTDLELLQRYNALMLAAARATYSMPPDHGAAIVHTILSDESLRQSWVRELEVARQRTQGLRQAFARELADAGCRFPLDCVSEGSGLFCLLPLPTGSDAVLRDEFGIYIVAPGRINISGLSPDNVRRVARAIAHVERMAPRP